MTSPPDDTQGAATLQPREKTSAEHLLERADVLATGARAADALPVYREALAAEPELLEARLQLARLLLRLDEPEAAIAALGDGLRHAPDQTELLVLRGGVYAQLRMYAESDADLRRVLRLHPSHATAHLELGRLLWRRGLVAEAAGHLQRALEFQPDSARACYYLGEALNQAADFAGARQALQRAVELDPRDAKAHHLLGRVLDRLGCPDEAREMYQRSRELSGA
jgi:tetratricopeptide (TPR) repeat protein